MGLLKPQPGTRLNRAHPLSQGLVQCWLLNEGAGQTLHDCVQGQTALGNPAPAWTANGCDFNGNDEAFVGDLSIDAEGPLSIVMQVRIAPVSSEHIAVGLGHSVYSSRLSFGCLSAGQYRILLREDDNSNVVNAFPASSIDDGNPHQLAFVFDPTAARFYCYMDGAALYDAASYPFSAIHFNHIAIGAEYYSGSLNKHWPGDIHHVYLYNRALAAGEVAQLWREPYAICDRPHAHILAAGIDSFLGLVTSVGAAGTCQATAQVLRGLGGETAANSQAHASLSQAKFVPLSTTTCITSAAAGTLQLASEVTSPWRADALFAGMTARALRLGTTLTGGWFWTRRAGCSALYRGRTLSEVDFGTILCVTSLEEDQIWLPAFVTHESDSAYVYVARRLNGCGHEEKTSVAAVAIVLAADGELASPAPNPVYGLAAQLAPDSRVTLRWFYCPLQQAAAPAAFIIRDENEIALGTIDYAGRRFYQFQTEPLAPGLHWFSIRAVTAIGTESQTPATASFQIASNSPPTPTVLAVETIS